MLPENYTNFAEGLLWFLFIGGMVLVVLHALISEWKDKWK